MLQDFLPAELIRKKRFGGEHTAEELRFLVQSFANDRIPDYQMSAWLMAVCFQGMSPKETALLTQEMRDSGLVLDLAHLGTTVDKHSTGGIGDKTSLLLAPIAAAAGLKVPMMAGRGLGHTGGTLDKLESIPGFNVGLSFQQLQNQLQTVGAAIIGQTKEICPADRKLYALRDVTGTVDSLPLICASIMSKKLAEGMSALVLDVKFGSGAFMKSVESAEQLGRALIDIGRHAGKKMVALLSRMDEPLGRFVGNALEVQECLDILDGKTTSCATGKTYSDTIELTLALAAHMIYLGGKCDTLESAQELATEKLQDGSAKAKFIEICARQGGRLVDGLPRAKRQTPVLAERDGFFVYKDLEKFGYCALHLGAGRKQQSDPVDPSAGLEVFCSQGQEVKKGDTLFVLYDSPGHHGSAFETAVTTLKEGFQIQDFPKPASPLIQKVLE